MGKPRRLEPYVKHLVELLKASLSQDPGQVLSLLAQAVQVLKSILGNRRHGIYEVLSRKTTVELMDSKGKEAVVTRLEKVRFLRDNTIAFYDTCWGGGEIFDEYDCSPGVPVDFFPDGARYRVLISLRDTKNHDDVLVFHVRRKIKGGFMKKIEWWETEIEHPTRWLGVRIVFPKGRFCQRATLTQRNKDKTRPLGAEHFDFLADGRQELSWEISRPVLHESYLIKWRW